MNPAPSNIRLVSLKARGRNKFDGLNMQNKI